MFERIFEFITGEGGISHDSAKKAAVSRGEFDTAERQQQEAREHELCAKNGHHFIAAVEEKETKDQTVARLKQRAENEARRIDMQYEKLKANGASPDEIHKFEKEKLGMQ